MKLRLRSIESNETLKVQLPNSCTLTGLKQILSELLPGSPPSASIRLSLNGKDDLQSDGEEFLHALGIVTGDLIFFSFEQHSIDSSSNSQYILPPRTESSTKTESMISESSSRLNSPNVLSEGKNSDSVLLGSHEGKTLGNDAQMEENTDGMEVEGDNEINTNSEGIPVEMVENSFSVPGFLRKVFTEKMDTCGNDHRLIVIAIHAVMLESGFVPFDRNANKAFTDFHMPLDLVGMSLYYTLPEILNCERYRDIKFVVLKFQSLQKFITVYGTLGNESAKGGLYRAHLNEDQLVPFLNAVWANCGEAEIITDEAVTSPEKEVFKFWRTVKDNIVLPLLIDLHEEAGLELPPCFMRLPTDLKSKILESLPAVDLARVSCVCSELQYLGSNDDLWKLKCSEEFGIGKKEPYGSWKKAFVMSLWNRWNSVRPSPFWPFGVHSRRRHSNPFMVPRVPRIIGGDYDIHPPPHGDEMHTRLRFHDSARTRRMDFSPQCNLGFRYGRFV